MKNISILSDSTKFNLLKGNLFKIRMDIATVVIFNSSYAYQKSPFVMGLFTPTHLPIKELTNCLGNKRPSMFYLNLVKLGKRKSDPLPTLGLGMCDPGHRLGHSILLLFRKNKTRKIAS